MLDYVVIEFRSHQVVERVRGASLAQHRFRELGPGHFLTRADSIWVKRRSSIHRPYTIPCLDCGTDVTIDPLDRSTLHVLCERCRQKLPGRDKPKAVPPKKQDPPPPKTPTRRRATVESKALHNPVGEDPSRSQLWTDERKQNFAGRVAIDSGRTGYLSRGVVCELKDLTYGDVACVELGGGYGWFEVAWPWKDQTMLRLIRPDGSVDQGPEGLWSTRSEKRCRPLKIRAVKR